MRKLEIYVFVGSFIAVVLVFLGLVLAGYIYLPNRSQSPDESQIPVILETFNNTTTPEERISSLAKLFMIDGGEGWARQLFFEQLNPEERQALFDLADPNVVGNELVTVIKGLYTDPRLVNTQPNNALLKVMTESLRGLQDPSVEGATELTLEITQWLKGRELYLAQGQQVQAIRAYDVAIITNNRNPGTYFDRGLAYADTDETSRALADFATTLGLDENWKSPVEQAIANDNSLYLDWWSKQDNYANLIALLPTPTVTPTPTNTPTPSPTPSPTNTVTPTATPTQTPTPSATPTNTPAPRPTPNPAFYTETPTPPIPTGDFTLLKPTFNDDPSHGLTTFEWQWTGGLPPGYGFEVRVWREGKSNHTGAHNAVLDNQNGNVERIGNNTYRLKTDIKEAAGVGGKTGEYLWTVGLVKISPEFADLGQEAEPERMRFSAIVPGGGGGGDDGGGGVGID